MINAQQQLALPPQQDLSLPNPNADQFKTDPRFLSWVGASIIPKLESAKDMFIPREKFIVEFKSYKDNYNEFRSQAIQQQLEANKSEAEEKKEDQEEGDVKMKSEEGLSSA